MHFPLTVHRTWSGTGIQKGEERAPSAQRHPSDPDLDRYRVLRDLMNLNSLTGDLADRKAAVLLAFVGVAGKGLTDPTAPMARSLFQRMSANPGAGEVVLAVLVLVLSAAFGIQTLRSVAWAFHALRPTLVRDSEPSRMFFADVPSIDSATWERSLMTASVSELNHDLTMQVYVTVRIAAAKHANVNRAISTITRYSLPTGAALYVIASLC